MHLHSQFAIRMLRKIGYTASLDVPLIGIGLVYDEPDFIRPRLRLTRFSAVGPPSEPGAGR